MESLKDNIYLEIFEKQGFYVGTTKGESMLPMIRSGIDSIVLEPINRKIKRYDCLMFRRDNGKYVMHRVLRVKKDGYKMCGDNQWRAEIIRFDMAVGVLKGYYKGERYIPIEKFSYKVYYHFRTFFRFWRFIKAGFRKVFRIIFKRKKNG